jgi:hypothetical protein
MNRLDTRLRRLEAEAAHAAEAQRNWPDAAAAHATLTEFFAAIAAEKAAGDVHGTAQRFLDGVLAELERQA